MTQSKFNPLSSSYKHKHPLDGLGLLSVAKYFASLNDVRYNYLGTFIKTYI